LAPEAGQGDAWGVPDADELIVVEVTEEATIELDPETLVMEGVDVAMRQGVMDSIAKHDEAHRQARQEKQAFEAGIQRLADELARELRDG
jgi:hypothetical protein